jgi:hypothetical protein
VNEPGRLLDDLRATPALLAVVARGAAPPPAGEWSATEVVGHLVAVEVEVWHRRLDQLSSGGEPHWSWIEPAPWDGPGSGTLDGALAAFADRRASTIARFDALDDAGWRRTGVHDTYGRVDARRLLEIAVDHDREHLKGLADRHG